MVFVANLGGNEPEHTMATKTPTQHGIDDARTFAEEHAPEELVAAVEPGQLGADESLISAMGVAATAKLFGVEAGSDDFTVACRAYNAAWLAEAKQLVEDQRRARECDVEG